MGNNLTAEEARTNTRINGYERPFNDTYFDIKVINTQADTHKQIGPGEAMKKAEDGKDILRSSHAGQAKASFHIFISFR